ncbi:S41 family peptidase [Stakelama pacifica]|uniref:Peptidase S41-like protein n=1 Tax=Stakelama pacifica TaxID=517720 RepID=A0A4R6FPA7_9SPHN|nr:S41 family peptidase [Stakelama pacifica]TDN82910.1 peptidase S41-like protein [Stakelama pacifica]GGO95227.1 peptidase S41 [Stakelama pacifica]
MGIGRTLVGALALAAMLGGCGGGGSSGSVRTPPVSGGGTTGGGSGGGTATAACSLLARQNWALAQMREWYLFPETLPASPDPSRYSTVQDFLNALTATARAQGKDRYFTYLTSIREENAYNATGAAAGFGTRFFINPEHTQLIVAESFENAPFLNAGIDRGAVVTAIGNSSGTMQSVATLYGSDGSALNDALTVNPGDRRSFTVADATGTRTVTVTASEYDIDPVSSRYGAKILTENGQKYGYLNLRTFISAADPELRAAMASFAGQGVDKVIVDLRYNGGGSLNTAELMANLMAGGRSSSEVMYHLSFRPEKASENETAYFAPQPESIPAMKIAFIGTYGSASASEMVMNVFIPYLGSNNALIGSDTYGKPVGQIGLDKSECDDRLRVIAIALRNADNQGEYYHGIASTMRATCAAEDDLSYPMGDPREASTRAALDFLEGKSCTPISPNPTATARAASASGDASARRAATLAPKRELLTPANPGPVQRDMPGLF